MRARILRLRPWLSLRLGRPWYFLMLTAAAAGLVTLSLPPALPAAAGGVPAFDHIFTILMENHNYDEIIGSGSAPYLNSLADQYGLAMNYHAVAHPSLPNYLALAGGDTFGVSDDCNDCYVSAPNLAVDRVQASGRTWRAYMESEPGPCTVGDAYPYMQKHDPFIYFDDIRTNPSECDNVVPLSDLSSDLASARTTPDYAWITPNMCDDTHDCPLADGDAWLSQTVPMILDSPAYQQQRTLLLIAWDENDNENSNQVAALVIAKDVAPGFRSDVAYDHYSLLKTIEEAWGLAPLTPNDTNASPMSDFFDPAPTPAPAGGG